MYPMSSSTARNSQTQKCFTRAAITVVSSTQIFRQSSCLSIRSCVRRVSSPNLFGKVGSANELGQASSRWEDDLGEEIARMRPGGNR